MFVETEGVPVEFAFRASDAAKVSVLFSNVTVSTEGELLIVRVPAGSSNAKGGVVKVTTNGKTLILVTLQLPTTDSGSGLSLCRVRPCAAVFCLFLWARAGYLKRKCAQSLRFCMYHTLPGASLYILWQVANDEQLRKF